MARQALMRESVRKINADFGRQVEAAMGMRDEPNRPYCGGLLRAEHDEPDGSLPGVVQRSSHEWRRTRAWRQTRARRCCVPAS